MKTSLKILCGALALAVISLVSCTKEEIATADANELHTCTMTLVGDAPSYDLVTKAGSATTWADGSTIYLRMDSVNGMTTGTAVYNATKGSWTLSYYGALYENETNLCTAIYVDNAVSVEGHVINTSAESGIYTDTQGSYLFKEGDLVVTANLSPKTGRIRFQGEAGTEMRVFGISHYSAYNNETDSYVTTPIVISTTVAQDGFTPYIYGFFTDEAEPTISLWIDAKEAFTRYCSSAVLNVGESGKMTIPLETAHNGWADGIILKANDNYYKLVAVSGGTFTMGNPESTEAKYTAHKVTLTGYCIGETELTCGFYYGATSNKNRPYHTYAYSASGFRGSDIEKINIKLGVNLKMPTEAQWEFAARGGNKSKGYKYSGSDSYDDVACTSTWSGSYKDVKTKLPNELGLYDMTGNAIEMVLDTYAVFSSASVRDPLVTPTTGGNSWPVCKSGDPLYAREYQSSSGYYVSTRLVLNW